MSSFRRSGTFDSADDSAPWGSTNNPGASPRSFWIRPPSFATGVLMFWIAVFAISMFWHRSGNSAGPVAETAADLYIGDPFPTSLPVYGYPEFDSASVYRYFYNLYMKRLMAASPKEAAIAQVPHPVVKSVPKRQPPKQETHRAAIETAASSKPEPVVAAAAPALVPAPASVSEERADLTNPRFAPPLNVPFNRRSKTVALPESTMPQWVLPIRARSAGSERPALKVAPVGLPGYEREPASAIPKSAVRFVYPTAEVVGETSSQTAGAEK